MRWWKKKRIKDATYGELEGLDKPNSLFNRTPDGEIVHGDLSVSKNRRSDLDTSAYV